MYTTEQLEQMLETAYAQRKQAYKIRAPRFVTFAINDQIADLKKKLAAA